MGASILVLLAICVVFVLVARVYSRGDTGFLERQYRELREAERLRARDLERQQESKKRREQEAFNIKLREFQSQFPCHHPDGCQFVSEGPYQKARAAKEKGYTTDIYWDTPQDMYRCEGCRGWFCQYHIATVGQSSPEISDGIIPARGYCYKREIERLERKLGYKS